MVRGTRKNPGSRSRSRARTQSRARPRMGPEIPPADVLCVGAGIAGAYMCYKLTEKHRAASHEPIRVLEAAPSIGGRMKSVRHTGVGYSVDEAVLPPELGAMRIFKCREMVPIYDLLHKFGIKTVHVGLDDTNNIFYYKNRRMAKCDVRLKGVSMTEFDKTVWRRIKHRYPRITPHNSHTVAEFQENNLQHLMKRYGKLSDAEYDMWVAFYGYDEPNTVQATFWLQSHKFYTTALSSKQEYVVGGTMSLVEKLFEHSRVRVTCGTKVVRVDTDPDGIHSVHAINDKHVSRIYKCRHLVLAITSNAVRDLHIVSPLAISRERMRLIGGIRTYALFKCFLRWDDASVWWGKGTPYQYGKSVTDLGVRQVHYYGRNYVLVYCSGKYADALGHKFEKNPVAAARTVFTQLCRIHGRALPAPQYERTVSQYWANGSSEWGLGVDQTAAVSAIPSGVKDGSNISVVGDMYSMCGGWMVGAIQSVDAALGC